MNLKKLFINHCKENGLEINHNQIKTIEVINEFYQTNFNNNFFMTVLS